jgi:hypothetical protein
MQPKQQMEQVVEKQAIADDLDRWRGESPAAGRVSTVVEEDKSGSIEKGLKAVAEYWSTLEEQVRRFPGSSILLAGASGVLFGFFLNHLVKHGFGRVR